MDKSKRTIELNGKKYDVKSGHLIDGFSARKTLQKNNFENKSYINVVKKENIVQKIPKSNKIHLITPLEIPKHKPQKSKTLVRKLLKKPDLKQVHNLQTPVEKIGFRPKNNISSFQSIAKDSAVRNLHAQQIETSKLIQKFHHQHKPIEPKLTYLPILSPPVQKDIQKAEKFFNDQLHKATSHLEAPFKKQKMYHKVAQHLGIKPKTVTVLTAILAVGLLSGFIIYQNVPNFAVRVAAKRAGFAAKLPGYTPAGFSLSGNVQYRSGQVSINFKSRSDNRNFTILEQKTDWNSQDLLQNQVVASSEPYQVYDGKGRTVYMFGNNKASWVNGGVWYSLYGNTNFSTDQLSNIANSL